MRSFTVILIFLLLAAIGGGIFFYLTIHQPMAKDYARMKTGISDLDRATSELKQYREQRTWVLPAVETFKASLNAEIKAGKAEVVAADDRVVINMKEDVLFNARAATFNRGSDQVLKKLASVLKNMKALQKKEILVGNAAGAVGAQRGRRTQGRDSLGLSMDRSLALVNALKRKGIAGASLIAVAYPDKRKDSGFRITDRKVMVIIGYPPVPEESTEAQKPTAPPAEPKHGAAPEAKKAAPAPPLQKPSAEPKRIPILPSPPKSE